MVEDSNVPLLSLQNFNIIDTVYDLEFKTVQDWRTKHPTRKVITTFPVYVPHELIHAMGHLPINIFGGGEQISISHADAILGSFICSISKSTTELLLGSETFQQITDGYVFPFICDVARNLSGIFGRRSGKPSFMLHLAQNVDSPAAHTYLKKEYMRMLRILFPDEALDENKLRQSIRLYNSNRSLQRKLMKLRWERPWDVPLEELYLLFRVGSILPVEDHNNLLEEAYDKFAKNDNVKRDAIRVVVTGNFCEQPPRDVIALIEQVGCYVIEDQFIIGRRFLLEEVDPDAADPVQALASMYINKGEKTATRYHQGEKGEHILERVEDAKADGVIFLTAKFCEPALDDLVLEQQALQEKSIPYVHIEYEERGSGYENIRLALETFVESLLFD